MGLYESGYDRRAHEFYPSIDPRIAIGLVWALKEKVGLDPDGLYCWEPCAGRGDLMHGLERHGMVVLGADIADHPGRDPRIQIGFDVMQATRQLPREIELACTNLPHGRKRKHQASCGEIAAKLLELAPYAWVALLLPAAWPSWDSPERWALLSDGRLHMRVELGRVFTIEPQADGTQKNIPKMGMIWLVFRPVDHPRAPIEYWFAPKLELPFTVASRSRI